MMKKLIALMLVTGVALPLAACDFGKKAPEQPTENTVSIDNTQIDGNATLADPGNDTMGNAEAPETNTADGNVL